MGLMGRCGRAVALFGVGLSLCACGEDVDEPLPTEPVPDLPTYEFSLPPGFPEPRVPEDNPMSEARIELGRHLFYDKKLSGNETQACASCHKQALAFTDGEAHAEGSTGDLTPRGSMTLANVAYNNTYGWANHLQRTLEKQALGPMFGEDPVELGLAGLEETLVARIAGDPDYPSMFAEAFPGEADPVNLSNIIKAISCWERTLISGRSAFDRFIYDGDTEAMSVSAQRGMRIFLSEVAECFHCHGGFNFSDAVTHEGKFFEEIAFHNNGLYNLDGEGGYPVPNRGIFELTSEQTDMGRFKAPTLRNIELTGPYMHDGSYETLEEVIEHYAGGGRLIEEGDRAGDGRDNPNKSIFVNGFQLSDRDKSDLLAFLLSLTDDEFITNPAFSNPFSDGPNAD